LNLTDLENKRTLMLETPLSTLIPKVALPSIISMLIGAVYNMVDTFFVGQLGNSASAAIGLVFPLSNLMLAISFSVAHGASSLIAQHLGKNDSESASRAGATAFYTALSFGIVCMIMGLLLDDQILHLLGATPGIMETGLGYTRAVFLGAPFFIGSNVMNNTLRAEGNATKALIGISSGAVLNMILDPLFIFGFGWGVTGAGAATMVGQVFGFLLLGYFYASKHSLLNLHPKYFTPKLRMYGNLLRIGFSSFLRMGLSSLAIMLLNRAAAPYGDAALSALSVVSRITWLVSAVLIGFGQGYQPVSGFNYGAGQAVRVEQAFRFSLKTAILFMLGSAVVLFSFAPFLVSLFRNDPDVIRIGTLTLRLQSATLPLQAMVVVTNMFFQSVGRALPSSILAFSRQGVCFIPLVYILPPMLGLTGVSAIQAVADVLAFLVCLPMTIFTIRRLRRESEAYQKQLS